MPLEGEQLTYGWALALDYHVGWRGRDLITSVALMCAESARYTLAWHANLDAAGNLLSTDWGIFQINDKAHPDLELPEDYRNVIANAEFAHQIYKDHGKSFNAWAAYTSGAYLKFVPAVTAAWLLPRWRLKVANVDKKFA